MIVQKKKVVELALLSGRVVTVPSKAPAFVLSNFMVVEGGAARVMVPVKLTGLPAPSWTWMVTWPETLPSVLGGPWTGA